MNLPAFSGDDPTCPKCGNEGASTRYVTGRDPFGCRTCPVKEHFHRECTRCGFVWVEAIVPSFEIEHLKRQREAH